MKPKNDLKKHFNKMDDVYLEGYNVGKVDGKKETLQQVLEEWNVLKMFMKVIATPLGEGWKKVVSIPQVNINKFEQKIKKLGELNFVKKAMHGYYALNSVVTNKIKEKGIDILIAVPKVK